MHETAILISSKNGEKTIAETVRRAAAQADVYVVSDGSTDRTVDVARAAGARVLARATSGGKPDALRAGARVFRLQARYRFIGVVDDDTLLAPDYVAGVTSRMTEKDAAASGRIDSLWDDAHRWNPYIAMRAFMYWSYQVTIKRGQNALGVVNVICGANSIFRADVFARLIEEEVPYAIDDMFWVGEIVRQRLGRIRYVHSARSWTIDPHTFHDWYRQTVRWSWAQFQSIYGHRLLAPVVRDDRRRSGWRLSGFNLAYLALVLDWIPYALEPLLVIPVLLLLSAWIDPMWLGIWLGGVTMAWIVVAAAALHRWRLILLAPALILLDLVYRGTMLHAFVKTVRAPRVETCRWDSPPRFELQADEGTVRTGVV
jgi:cellulose synthase/poly-beta-1,6-N-acetylglucosamine synthase-like glycosyltransferase